MTEQRTQLLLHSLSQNIYMFSKTTFFPVETVDGNVYSTTVFPFYPSFSQVSPGPQTPFFSEP